MATVALPFRAFPAMPTEQARFRSLPTARLLALSQAGDTEARHDLMGRYRGVIQAAAWRLAANSGDAAELFGEAYLHLFRVLNPCRNVETLPGWITRITTHVFFRQCDERRRRNEVSLDDSAADALPGTAPDPADTLLQRFRADERRARLASALASLPALYRTQVNLFYGECHSYEEVASRTGLPINTVKSRLFRARVLLRRKLGDLAV